MVAVEGKSTQKGTGACTRAPQNRTDTVTTHEARMVSTVPIVGLVISAKLSAS